MQLTHDPAANALRVTLENTDTQDRVAFRRDAGGILDVGEGGRLIGVEFPAEERTFQRWLADDVAGVYASLDSAGHAYLQIVRDDVAVQPTRSAAIAVHLEFNDDGEIVGVVIPRRGDGYEITYPSGNQ